MLGRLEARPTLRLKIQHFELQHRIDRWAAALRPIRAAERFLQTQPERLDVDDLQELLQWIALLGKLGLAIMETAEPGCLDKALLFAGLSHNSRPLS